MILKSATMFAQRTMPSKLDEEFCSVESIMKCDDFKSNFARKLSNRFITRPFVSPRKQEDPLKFILNKINSEDVPNVPERIESCSQLSTSINLEQNGKASVDPSDKISPKNDIRNTEAIALNMEVETLRWQLAQTEANRQMHIALLRQIVTFLNKVKDHIDQNKEPKKEIPPTSLGRSFNFADLPRSRSVLHVNKNVEYTTTTKTISTRKISKSISNVNGYKDCHGAWNQPKLCSSPTVDDNSQKITEEMSRLITLANTVLSTKLPNLACSCSDFLLESEGIKQITAIHNLNDAKQACQRQETDADFIALDNERQPYEEARDDLNNIITSLKLTCDIPDKYPNVNNHEDRREFFKNEFNSSVKVRKISIDKKSDCSSSHYVEDESGFSSMNSFQEIGIPIISIIPPSPCKEVDFLEHVPIILDESEKWKTEIELDKQSVKVFWV